MDSNFEINEYETLPKDPLFKPEPPKSIIPSIGVEGLAADMRSKAQGLMPSQSEMYDDLSAFSSMGKDQRPGLLREGLGRDAYTKLSDGTLVPKFDKFNPALSAQVNEEILAKGQSASEKWANGIPKLIGKTGVNVAGGLVGSVNGLIQAIRYQSLGAMYDNNLTNYLEDTNKRMDSHYANYRTAAEADMNFGQKLGTANFWADDFLGGLSFLAGTIISEGVWAAATGGTSLVAKGAMGAIGRGVQRGLAGKLMATLKEIAKKEGKQILKGTAKEAAENVAKAGVIAGNVQQGLNTARFLYTSAGYESTVEAKGFLEEAEAEYVNMMLTEEGRMPTGAELGAFKADSVGSANTVFGANLGLVGFSNFTVLGKLLLGKSTSRKLSNSFFNKNVLGMGFKKEGSKLTALTPTKFQKNFGKAFSVGKPVFTEGVIEEGGQASLAKGATEYMLSGYDTDSTNDNLGAIDALLSGIHETYTTKEGLTEVGLGSLIGLFGGAVATKGRFNELSNERSRIQGTIDHVNNNTKEMLVNHMVASNKVARAAKLSDEAEARGDLTGQMTYDTAAITAIVERANLYQGTKEMLSDFQIELDQQDNIKLADQMGMTEAEVKTWKSEKFQEFKDVAERHQGNLEYAEALLGDKSIAGLDNIEGLDKVSQADLTSAIAFSLTMGYKSDEFSEALATQLKQIVAKDFDPQTVTDALTVNSVLQKVGNKEQIKYNTAGAKVKKLQSDVVKLENALIEAQNITEVGAEGAASVKTAKLNRLTLRLTKVQAQLAEAQQNKDLAFDALNIPQLTEEYITQDMLDGQQEAVNKLNTTLQTIAKRNPQQNMAISRIMEEYDRAVQQTKTYNQVVQTLVDPKTRVSTLNGWAAKLVNRKKSVNGNTAEMFVEATKNYIATMEGVKARSEASNPTTANPTNTQGANPTGNPLSNPADNAIAQLNNQANQQSTTVTNTPNSVIEMLKAKVQEIVKGNAYANARFSGELDTNLEDAKPTQEEIDRYNELLNKIPSNKNKRDILIAPYNSNGTSGLTEAETAELKNLNRILNDWQILSGLNDKNSSIADVLELIDQLEQGFIPSKTQTEAIVKEFFRPEVSSNTKGTPTSTNLNTIISPDNALAKKQNGNYEISHVKIQSLNRLFPGSEIFVIQGGRAVNLRGIPSNKLNELNQTPGLEITVKFEGETLNIVTNENQRLVMPEAQLEAMIPKSTFKILDFGNSNYMPLFIEDGNGGYTPMPGDFTIESVIDNEFISLNTEKLYELDNGTLLRTEVNLNDTYNAQLLKDYKNGAISKEEFTNNLSIYLSSQGSVNEVLGTLRGIKESSNKASSSFATLHMIRKQAAKRALATTTSKVEVGIAIPLGMTLMGSPNLAVKDVNGTIEPQNIDITDEALSMVEDYGYMVDGKLFTNKNLVYTEKDTIFARKTSGKEYNKGVKVPVVVFKYKSRTVVFPVGLKQTTQGKVAEVQSILVNNNLSDANKIYEINEVLKENNIDPNNYAIYDLVSENSVDEVNRMLGDVMSLPDFVNIEDWIQPGFDKAKLQSQVEIAIDITDRPFSAPKGILKFSEVQMPTEEDMRLEAVDILDRFAKKVNNIFSATQPFANMTTNTKFYDAFEEKGINMEADMYINKMSNANILMNAFNQPLPKSVRDALGEKLINDIKFEIKQYQIINEGLKTNTSAVQGKLSSTINNAQNQCK